MASIPRRLMQLESNHRFLSWFARARFIDSLTDDELESYMRGGIRPEIEPGRPSKLDRLDRRSLIKLWEEDERISGGRSHEELVFYTENGYWPEQRGRFHYSMENGKMLIEWRIESAEENG